MDATDLWTLDQLAEQVESGLAVGYPGAPNGRVRSVPDRRAIRWYTTIGLIDRPAATRGRTALYARRHLLQLVAIKRRQAEGRSLAEIQAELAGATDATLQSIARLPEAAAAGPHRPPAAPRVARFWTATAANTPACDSAAAGPAPGGPAPADSASVDPESGVTTSAAAQPPAAVDADLVASPDHRPAVTGPAATATGAAAGLGVTALGAAAFAPTPILRRETAVDGALGGGTAGVAGDVDPAASRHGSAAGHGATKPPAEAADRWAADHRAALASVAPAVVLPGGITLLLPAGTPYPGDNDIHAIRAAAVPLLAELSRRGLSDTESTEGTP